MGPFLGVILAAVASTLALDLLPVPERIERAPATMLAIAIVAGAWLSSRLHPARGFGPVHAPRWARPMDLGLFAVLLLATHWTAIAREATGDLPFLRQILVLAPYFLASLARVDATWPGPGSAIHHWTRARAVTFHARLLLIPIAPILLVNGGLDALRRSPAASATLVAYPALEFGVVIASFLLVVLAMPVLLAWILGTRRLAAGPLRAALESDLARQRARIGGIDEVDTGSMIANAAYLGLFTRFGRIFISDALLRVMPEDEIRAVFAHEVAHGTRRHLVWLLGFLVASITGYYLVSDLFDDLWGAGIAFAALTIAGTGAFVAISRRFEVEADLVGAETLGDSELFGRALARVAAIAGKPIDRHGLRHYAIATRIGIVQACAHDATTRARWAGRIRAPKIAIAGFLAVVLAGFAWKLPADLGVSRAARDLAAGYAGDKDAESLRLRGDPGGREQLARAHAFVASSFQSAAERSRAALSHPLVRARAATVGIAALMGLADEALQAGDFAEARRIAADIEEHWPAGDPFGDFNRKMLRAELAAIDPARDLASARADVKAAQDGIRELLSWYPGDESSALVEQELRFLAAATGLEGAVLDFEADAFPASQMLAVALGAQVGAPETRDLAARLEAEHAWRRVVLERALSERAPGGAGPQGAVESRKGM